MLPSLTLGPTCRTHHFRNYFLSLQHHVASSQMAWGYMLCYVASPPPIEAVGTRRGLDRAGAGIPQPGKLRLCASNIVSVVQARQSRGRASHVVEVFEPKVTLPGEGWWH
jgi:hypothetical protein